MNDQESALAKSDAYAIFQPDASDIGELIAENVGPTGISQFDLDRVTIPAGGGKRWAIPTVDGEESLTELVGIPILFRDGRVCWLEPFEVSGGGKPPDCVSQDGIIGVGNPGGKCATCPYAQWGSDPRGGPGQACKQIRHVYHMMHESVLPLVLCLPPTSIAACRRFFLRLAGRQIPYWSVVVSITLKEAMSKAGIKYSQADMSLVRQLSTEERNRIANVREALRPALMAVQMRGEDYADAA